MRFALLSVFDKTGIVDFAKTLDKAGYKIVSTGGTANVLQEAGIDIIPIKDITGNPESFDGRMKTISFQAEGGILYDRSNPKHVKEAARLKVPNIEVVVCNLYPFEKTVKRKGATYGEIIENIDVGGPTMIRSAGKNHKSVLVVVSPDDYERVAKAISSRSVSQKLRRELAQKAFAHLSFYDAQIASFLSEEKKDYPKEVTIPGRKILQFRYGDNPHQTAALYENPTLRSPLTSLTLKAGRELSQTNFTDINAGYESVRLFKEPAAVIIKHNNPCGLALGKTAAEALRRAIAADPESAFGGVVVLNKPMDLKAAQAIESFKKEKMSQMDIIAAPSVTNEALELIRKVRKTTGVYIFGKVAKGKNTDTYVKGIDGGFILQSADVSIERSFKKWEVVTKVKPTKKVLEQMRLGWKIISRIKSNAIIVMDPNVPMTRGIGSGQTSRVRSTRIALDQAGKYAKGAILVSDSFFPFPDSVEMAAKVGIKAIVQQGDSIRDKDSIEMANKHKIAMVLTHTRAFWH